MQRLPHTIVAPSRPVPDHSRQVRTLTLHGVKRRLLTSSLGAGDSGLLSPPESDRRRPKTGCVEDRVDSSFDVPANARALGYRSAFGSLSSRSPMTLCGICIKRSTVTKPTPPMTFPTIATPTISPQSV